MEFKRIDVLLHGDKEFRVGDIVEIFKSIDVEPWLCGRVVWIDTLKMKIDYSIQYESKIAEIKYKDIYNIRKVE